MQKARPRGITVLSIVLLAAGVLNIFGSASIFLTPMSLLSYAYPGLQGLFTALGVLSLVFGVGSAVSGVGIWRGKRWAWMIAVVLSVAGIAVSAVLMELISYNEVVSIVINAVILYYVTRPSVRKFFTMGPLDASSPAQQPSQK